MPGSREMYAWKDVLHVWGLSSYERNRCAAMDQVLSSSLGEDNICSTGFGVPFIEKEPQLYNLPTWVEWASYLPYEKRKLLSVIVCQTQADSSDAKTTFALLITPLLIGRKESSSWCWGTLAGHVGDVRLHRMEDAGLPKVGNDDFSMKIVISRVGVESELRLYQFPIQTDSICKWVSGEFQ